MSLRNKPYLPLFVDDFANDEQLGQCSLSGVGLMIRVMCLMHKTEPYGKVLLKQKFEQTDSKTRNFALQFAKVMPHTVDEIEPALIDMLAEGVVQIEENYLVQRRMVRDNKLSEVRAAAAKGGETKSLKVKEFVDDFASTKGVANAGMEWNGIEDKKIGVEKSKIEKPKFIPPTLDEVKTYFIQNGYKPEAGEKAWRYYNEAEWKDSTGKQVKNWKQKMQGVWFKEENKSPITDTLPPKEGFKISRNPTTGAKFYEKI